jgi:hypothetical protein
MTTQSPPPVETPRTADPELMKAILAEVERMALRGFAATQSGTRDSGQSVLADMNNIIFMLVRERPQDLADFLAAALGLTGSLDPAAADRLVAAVVEAASGTRQ